MTFVLGDHQGSVITTITGGEVTSRAQHLPDGSSVFYVGVIEATRSESGVWGRVRRSIVHAGVTVASQQHTTTTTTTGGEVSFVLGDRQGSVTTTVTGGEVTSRWYGPYGARRGPDPAVDDRVSTGWLNQREDATGLVYLNNRYYDPVLGTFISVDPLVGSTGEPYGYGSGNPVVFSDPTGLCTDPGCWDFLGVVVRELVGQEEPGTAAERQEEYNDLMASSMELRMELLGPDSWSSRDRLYYQQLSFGPTYELPDAGNPLDWLWDHRREILTVTAIVVGAVCIGVSGGTGAVVCVAASVAIAGAEVVQSAQDNLLGDETCPGSFVADVAGAGISLGAGGAAELVPAEAFGEGAQFMVRGYGLLVGTGVGAIEPC